MSFRPQLSPFSPTQLERSVFNVILPVHSLLKNTAPPFGLGPPQQTAFRLIVVVLETWQGVISWLPPLPTLEPQQLKRRKIFTTSEWPPCRYIPPFYKVLTVPIRSTSGRPTILSFTPKWNYLQGAQRLLLKGPLQPRVTLIRRSEDFPSDPLLLVRKWGLRSIIKPIGMPEQSCFPQSCCP